ncbi:hypothetical protein [Brachyspira sp.]|uniref:hypothetical protein n=1 Tax=Brachyspira sp. TaxID=1977261 RepID=UPI003D7E338E
MSQGLGSLLKNTFKPDFSNISEDSKISVVVGSDFGNINRIAVDEIIDFKYKSSVDSFTLIEITIPYSTSASELDNKKVKNIFNEPKNILNALSDKKTFNSFLEIFPPFSFRACSIYYDNYSFEMMRGIILNSVPSMSEFGYVLNVTIASSASILNDCNVNIASPIAKLEFKNATLKDIVYSVANAITCDFYPQSLATKYKFDKVAIEPDQNIFDFLTNLVQSEGILITDNTYEMQEKLNEKSTASGGLVLHKIQNTLPVCSLREDEAPFISASPSFNPQQYFSKIICLTPVSVKQDSSKRKSKKKETTKNKRGEYPLKDVEIPKSLKKIITGNDAFMTYRTHVFKAQAEKNKTIDAYKEAKAKYGRMLANSVNYQITVQGHKNPQTKKLFRKGDIISVYAPHSAIMQACNFVVKELELSRTVAGGDVSNLTLALPDAYLDDINIPVLFNNLPFFQNDVNQS